jgi:hypothetical protein
MKTAEVNYIDGTKGLIPVLSGLTNQDHVLIDMSVVKRLIDFLPSVPEQRIKDRIVENLRSLNGPENSLQDMIHFMREEVSFHETVDLVREHTAVNHDALIA